jgi:succinoglycan biosynthesis protein ExoM
VRIAICIATCRRPRLLGVLLDSLATLTRPPSAELLVVVVDNDDGASAAPVLAIPRDALPGRLLAAHEPRRNIAIARNRCVALALAEGADWLAFVDDDEQVTPGWLVELLRVQAESGADIVGGTVRNSYAAGVPQWIVDASLPDRRRHPTGSETDGAETSNVLVSARAIGLVPGIFDERFGVTGGSDSLFFLAARRAGARIVWADDAIVHETFDRSRGTVGWLMRRAFRIGNSSVTVARALLPLARWLPRRLAGAGYRIVRGLLLLPVALGRGRAAQAAALQDLCVGAGALAGIAGIRYAEYARIHGE